jgi:hypothetical protein
MPAVAHTDPLPWVSYTSQYLTIPASELPAVPPEAGQEVLDPGP